MDEFWKYLGLFINAMLTYTPPILFAALGSCISERSGVVNIGIEGMMTAGAFTGACLAALTGNPWLAFFLGGAAGAAIALIHAFACISCAADQTISGTAINFLAPGVFLFLCQIIYGGTDSAAIDPTMQLPKLFNTTFPTGSFGYNTLRHSIVTYLCFVLVLVMWFVFYKTKFGMRLRAVGEHPRACETLGINVFRVRYICVITSGFFAGLGGAFLTMVTTNQFKATSVVGQGFIAIAAVIFGKFTPQGAMLACLLFGLCNGFRGVFGSTSPVVTNLLSMIPYVVTIIVLILFVGKARVPAANGKPYIKSK